MWCLPLNKDRSKRKRATERHKGGWGGKGGKSVNSRADNVHNWSMCITGSGRGVGRFPKRKQSIVGLILGVRRLMESKQGVARAAIGIRWLAKSKERATRTMLGLNKQTGNQLGTSGVHWENRVN